MKAERTFKTLVIIKIVALAALAIYFVAYGAYMLNVAESGAEGVEQPEALLILGFASIFVKLGSYVYFAIAVLIISYAVSVVIEFLVIPNGARIIFVISDFISNIFMLAMVLLAVNSEIFTVCAIMFAFLLYFVCVDIAGFCSYREYKRLKNASRGRQCR